MERRTVVLILAAAWVSAAALTWFLYLSTKAPRVEKTVAVWAAAHDMPAGTLLRKGDLKTVRFPEPDVPSQAILDETLALDRPLLYPVSANEPVMASKVAGVKGVEGLPATIEIGMRAIAVPVTDASGVAGLIQPRAHVDVLFTRAGPMSEALTTTILKDVVVLAIGRTTETVSSATAAGAAAAAQSATRPSAQSATLLVDPEQAQMIELAKNLGKLSLALRNPLDRTVGGGDSATKPGDIDRGMTPPPRPAIIKPAAPPPKPAEQKNVEIFRGSEHVQRSFE